MQPEKAPYAVRAVALARAVLICTAPRLVMGGGSCLKIYRGDGECDNVPGSETRDCYNVDNSWDCAGGACDCTACPAGWGAPEPGEACAPCAPGQYSPFDVGAVGLASTGCLSCAPGQYADAAGSLACTPCPAGRFSAEVGANHSSRCALCPLGRFTMGPGAAACVVLGQLDQCGPPERCPPGTRSEYASESDCPGELRKCALCSPGYYSSSRGRSSCSLCPDGTRSTAGSVTCLSGGCPAGTYLSQRVRCAACPPNQVSAGGSGTYSCTTCAAGTVPDASASFCEELACAPGQYLHVATSSCISCAAGKYEIHGGQTNCRGVCDVGHSSPLGSSSPDACTACAAGTYGPSLGGTCIACAMGRYSAAGTGQTSSSTCLACGPGRHTEAPGSTACVACAAGRYSAVMQPASNCTACPAGKYSTAGAGQTNATTCLECSAGRYSLLAGQSNGSACISCPAGRYSISGAAQANSSVCLACGAGRYNTATGQTSPDACSLCPPNTFHFAGTIAQTSNESCIECLSGRFSVAGADSHTHCVVQCGQGQFNDGTSCAPCPRGTWQNLTLHAHMTCMMCAAGTSQPATGQTSATACVDCATGKFAADAGSSSCVDCAAGRFANQTQQTSCTMCADDTNSIIGAVDCTPCAQGRYSVAGGLCIAPPEPEPEPAAQRGEP